MIMETAPQTPFGVEHWRIPKFVEPQVERARAAAGEKASLCMHVCIECCILFSNPYATLMHCAIIVISDLSMPMEMLYVSPHVPLVCVRVPSDACVPSQSPGCPRFQAVLEQAAQTAREADPCAYMRAILLLTDKLIGP